MGSYGKRTAFFLLAAAVLTQGGCAARGLVCPSVCTELEKQQAELLEEQKKYQKTLARLAAEELKKAKIENRRLEKKYRKVLEE